MIIQVGTVTSYTEYMWENNSDSCQRCGQIGTRSGIAGGVMLVGGWEAMAGKRKKLSRLIKSL